MSTVRRMPLRIAVPVIAAAAAIAAVPGATQAAGARAASPQALQQSIKPLSQPGATPAVVGRFDAPATYDFYYTGSDGHAYEGLREPDALATTLQGGNLIGGPGAPPAPAFTFFYRGTNNALWENAVVSLGGRLTSRPGAASGALSVPGGQSIDVVVRGTDGAVWDKEKTTGWRPWRSLGGRLLAGSGPAALNVGGTLYVLAVGTDRAVWVKRSTDGVHWSGWRSLGGTFKGDLGVASPTQPAGQRPIAVAFARGTNNAAWFTQFAGPRSGLARGWHTLGGRLTSGVGAGWGLNGITWVLVIGTDNHIWQASGFWPHIRGWSIVAGELP